MLFNIFYDDDAVLFATPSQCLSILFKIYNYINKIYIILLYKIYNLTFKNFIASSTDHCLSRLQFSMLDYKITKNYNNFSGG